MDMARLSSNNSGVGPETDSPPAYQPGSLEDFNRLYEATYRRLFRTLVTLLRNRAAAEDCVQESYLRAYRAWPTWRPDAPVEATTRTFRWPLRSARRWMPLASLTFTVLVAPGMRL